MRALFLVLVASIACNKTESVATAPSATASTPAPPPAASSSAPAVAVVDAGKPSVYQEQLTLAQRWSDALARHDVEALRDVYATRVAMYGTSYDRDAAIAAKKAALTGDYTQSIASLQIIDGDPARPAAVFEKTWTVRGKTSHVRASLHFEKENGHWRVVEESDVKTDELLLSQSCMGLVQDAVLSTDDGKAYRGNGYGTMYVCGPPECDTFQIAGIHIGGVNMEMQRLASFDVDQKKGVVSHAGVELKADPAIVARMKAACAKEAAQGK